MKCECFTIVHEEEIKLNLLYDPDELTLYILKNFGNNDIEKDICLLGNGNYIYVTNKQYSSTILFCVRDSARNKILKKLLKWEMVIKIISESEKYKVDESGILYNSSTNALLLSPYNEDIILTLKHVSTHAMATKYDKAKEVIYLSDFSTGFTSKYPSYLFTNFPNCEILRIPNNTSYPCYGWKLCFPKLKKMIFGKLKTDAEKIREDAKTAGFDENSDLEIIQEFYIDRTGKQIENEG